MIYVETMQNPGQRKFYKWSVYDDSLPTEDSLVTFGDSHYKWNAKRAARRAAKRHAEGLAPEYPEIYEEMFENNAS